MAFRKKIYYPDSQIEKNLYTRGKEWMFLDDWKEYVGYYHKYSNGEVYTEREWDSMRSKRLVVYKENPNSYFRYLDLKNYTEYRGEKYEIIGSEKIYSYVAPRAVKVVPSMTDTENGFMNRYFVYKRNEPNRIMYEVDEPQIKDFDKLNAGINHNLYGYITIPWKLTGPEFDVIANGITKTTGVASTNQRIIDRFSKKFPILNRLLNNPREHSIYDKPR
jgi:hypothetical protein